MQGPIDRRDSGTGGVIAFGHRWSHCSRAYMLRWDPDTNGPCLATQAQMVLLHLGTDGPLHSGTDGPFTFFFLFFFFSGTDSPVAFGHRWSLAFGHRWSLYIFFLFFFS